jgi:hypothetical protein
MSKQGKIVRRKTRNLSYLCGHGGRCAKPSTIKRLEEIKDKENETYT